MPFAIDLEKTRTDTSLVRLEPALNAFGSMLLITTAKDEPGIHDWVTKTCERMSSDEKFRHTLVLIGFHYAVLPQKPEVTFESYLASLDATPPSEFRERLLNAYAQICMTEEAKKDRIPEVVPIDNS